MNIRTDFEKSLIIRPCTPRCPKATALFIQNDPSSCEKFRAFQAACRKVTAIRSTYPQDSNSHAYSFWQVFLASLVPIDQPSVRIELVVGGRRGMWCRRIQTVLQGRHTQFPHFRLVASG